MATGNHAAIDHWTIVVYSIAALVMVSLGIYVIANDQSIWSFLVAFVLLAGGSVPLQLAVPGTRYQIDTSSLYVTAGFLFRWEIELESIVRVLMIRHSSSTAFHLATIRIDYFHRGKKRHFFLSPDNTERFLLELAVAEPGLIFSDGCLLRSPVTGQ